MHRMSKPVDQWLRVNVKPPVCSAKRTGVLIGPGPCAGGGAAVPELHAEVFAEVNLAGLGVAGDFLCGALLDDAAFKEDVGAVNNAEGF